MVSEYRAKDRASQEHSQDESPRFCDFPCASPRTTRRLTLGASAALAHARAIRGVALTSCALFRLFAAQQPNTSQDAAPSHCWWQLEVQSG